MTDILVVYYSFSGTTRRLAGEIAKQTGGDLRELVPQKPYSFYDNHAAKEARKEIEQLICPPLLSGLEPVTMYEWIFLGTPNWFKSFTPPVLSFIKGVDLEGKTIIPFCTHGGGGSSEIMTKLRACCPKNKMLTCYSATGATDKLEIVNWLHEIEFKKDRFTQ
ncbi:flavodoxin [Oscillospiraceae bacterium WX1]